MLDRIRIIIFLFLFLAQASSAFGGSFVYQGRLLNEDGTTGITDTVAFLFTIYNPAGNCLLYQEETASYDLSTTDGFFSFTVGTETGDSKRTPTDPALSMTKIFSNSAQIRLPSTDCASGYTPGATDNRILRVAVFPSQGSSKILSPDLPIYPVPNAMVADTLQGLTASQFIKTSGTSTQLTIDRLTSGTDIGDSLHHHDSLYVKAGASNSSFSMNSGSTLGLGTSSYLQLGSFTSNPTGLSTADAGKTWYNKTTQQLFYFDGTSAVAVGTSSGPTISATAPVHYTSGVISIDAASTSQGGALSAADWNTFSNKLSKTLNSGNIFVGNISNVATAALMSGDATLSNTGALALATTGVPAGTYAKVTVDTKGRVTSGTALSGSDVPLTANVPIRYSSGAISVDTANTSQGGVLSAADWNTFNNKLNKTLNSANIFVGNVSNVATPALMSGDATLSNTGALALSATGVSAGTYTKVTVDAKGRVTAGTQLASNDVPTASLPAGTPYACTRFEITNSPTLDWMFQTGTGSPNVRLDIDCNRFKADGSYDTGGFQNIYGYAANGGALCPALDSGPQSFVLTESRPSTFSSVWYIRCATSSAWTRPRLVSATCCKIN